MADMKPIQYTSRDGLTIHGYLTLPIGRGAEEPAGRRESARRTLVPRPLGIQPRGAVPGQPRLRRPADELPRLDRLRQGVLGGLVQGVGRHDAGRHHRRRAVADPAGDRRSEAGRDLRRRPTAATRPSPGLPSRPDLYACGVDYVGVSNLFTFMNTFPPYWELGRKMIYEMVGDPETGQGSDDRRLAVLPRRPDQGAAAGGAGRERPARQQGRVGPDRRRR